ncbi:hypothetical protein FJY63_09780, partial [Candidatus Sumerlaeota bacterium]|nr:hypothetical protein [Candidatus Sumerlaeota bacterium]
MRWQRSNRAANCAIVCLAISLFTPFVPSAVRAASESSATDRWAFQSLVESDWDKQEQRRGRSPSSPDAIRDALERSRQLLDDLRRMPGFPDDPAAEKALERLRGESGNLDSLGEDQRLALYHRARAFSRDLALKNPLLDSRPIVFLKRRRFICQMLHEYLGYFYDYENIEGGGVFILEKPGRSLATRD